MTSDVLETLGATTLVDVLRERADRHGPRPLYEQLSNGEIVASLSYAEADRRARALATHLRTLAEPGERVLLLYPFGLEYPSAFLACLYAGLTAVPAFPPDKQRAVKTMPRIAAIIRDADAKLILTTAELAPTVEFARAEAPDPEALSIIASDAIAINDADVEAWRRPEALERELAFLQYTSGSTGTPRGVMIGHDNLFAHQRLAHEKFAQPEAARTVSWLPFYHDMGLIGSLLYPLYHGGTTMLMSPVAFLRRPLSWLAAISTHRASVSTGPNFAYDLCVNRARDEDLVDLDLSTWKLTVSGAEPLRASTIERFSQRFASCGFAPETFMPCFGMAEATLMVSGWPLERAPKIVWFDKRELWAGQAVELPAGLDASERGERGRAFVSCGTPMREHQIAIVDPETRVRCREGQQGEIWLRGPSVGRGYWGDAETSAARFTATIVDEDPEQTWFRTADTGFVHAGELFGSGRIADLVIVEGRVHQPHDIERSVCEGPEALVKDCAVFRVDEGQGRARICLAATGRRTMADDARRALCDAIYERVRDEHELELDRVLLIPQRSVAKTTSGKLRRFRYREAVRNGEFDYLCERSR